MLIDIIKQNMMQARQGTDPVAKSLWVTLYAETSRVGKDKRNGVPTDEECIIMIRKFINNAQHTLQLLQTRNLDNHIQQQEIVLLSQLLPQQLTEHQLQEAIELIISLQGAPRHIQSLGAVMSTLKKQHAGTFDARLASDIARQQLQEKSN